MISQLTVVALLAVVALTTAGSAASSACSTRSLYVVAHPDDSILFQAPDVAHDAQAGDCVETIVVTAGDAGYDAGYWQDREAGTMAAYAKMVGAPDTWSQGHITAGGNVIATDTLDADPSVSIVFMNLPDGNEDGSGFAADGNQSLRKLWEGTIPTIDALDGTASYTKASLTSTLASLITAFAPNSIHTQDLIGTFADADHTDHHAVAYFTRLAQRQYTSPHTLIGYVDSPIWQLPVNLSAADQQLKQDLWFAYAPYDSEGCQDLASCQVRYAQYWSRQYTEGVSSLPTAIQSLAPSAAAVGKTVTISGNGFAGATGVAFNGTSATFTVVSDTQITATVPAGATTGPVTVTGPAGDAASVGSFTVLPPPPPPTVGAFAPASGAVGAIVTLSGSGLTDATGVTFNGTTAPYHVDSDTQITAVVPTGATSGAIAVSNGGGTTTGGTFTVTSQTPAGDDLGRTATATASTQSTQYSQTADKAIDGFTDGCCNGDYTHEWATTGEGVGAWLNLAWPTAQTLTSVTLFDRPNPNDQITGATITFSDGSTVAVPSLPNDGSPLTVTFTPRSVTSLRMTVTSVSASTGNVGLAEIEAGSSSAVAPQAPPSNGGGGQSSSSGDSASAGTDTTPSSGAAASNPGTVARVTGGAVAQSVEMRGITRATTGNSTARVWINRKSVLYAETRGRLLFRSTHVTSVTVRGASATLVGVGVRDGKKDVPFRVVLIAGKPASLHAWFGKSVRSSRLISGTATIG